MLCTSLRRDGEEYVAWPRTLTEFRAGGATAIPLLHPWANRLGKWGYGDVDLRGLALPVDKGGVPLHGNLLGVPFAVQFDSTDRLVASLDYNDPRAFPFPHTVTVDARLHADRGLTITTEVRPTLDRAVPISFGWHPYVRLPHAPRREWELRWPACEHIEVDDRVIPTGARTPQPEQREPIGSRTFDDHYALGRDRTFAISARGRALTLEFDDNYPYAQLWVPARRQHLSIEPMTAEIDALGRALAPIIEPGESFRASFTIAIDR
jgi:galactose mutarotase-like enzyme